MRRRTRVRVGLGLHRRDALGDTDVIGTGGLSHRNRHGHAHRDVHPTGTSTGTSSATPATSSASASASASATQSATPTPTPTPSQSANAFPTAAPETGGGGTAGFQDTLLVTLGGAAILAGAGSIVYRRRVIRNR